MTVHRIVLVDRNASGIRHRHRWAVSCSCGRWWGVHRRRKQEAVAQHHRHVDSTQSHRGEVAPQSLTKRADLPELLR